MEPVDTGSLTVIAIVRRLRAFMSFLVCPFTKGRGSLILLQNVSYSSRASVAFVRTISSPVVLLYSSKYLSLCIYVLPPVSLYKGSKHNLTAIPYCAFSFMPSPVFFGISILFVCYFKILSIVFYLLPLLSIAGSDDSDPPTCVLF